MRKLFLLSLFFLGITVVGQDLPTIVPPSPTAFELGKYGEVPVGMFTGTANVSIPLYQYKTKNLSVPITLSYNSNGLRVDQMTSWVGLGWSLNAGGVITRTIKDEDDDGAGAGLMRNAPDKEIDEMVAAGGNTVNPKVLDFYIDGTGSGVDTEYDIYNFNVMGASGRFILDRQNRVHILSDNPLLKITTTGYQFNRTFAITTQDGVTYEFTAIESSDVLVPPTASYDPPRTVTSWFMTKIIHPLGDEITFTYTSNNYQFVQAEGESYSKLLEENECDGDNPCAPGNLSTSETRVSIYGVNLTGISSNNPSAGNVVFSASNKHPDIPFGLLDQVQIKNANNTIIEDFTLQYTITNNTRAFLDKVILKDPKQFYELSYIDKQDFPSRLSKAQDYWGYYNGKINTHRVPKNDNPIFNNFGADRKPSPDHAKKGLLQRITYPTKGYNEFVYEPNRINENQFTYPLTRERIHSGSLNPNNINIALPNNYIQNSIYPTRVVAYMDLEGYSCPNCTGTGQISIYDNTENRTVFSKTVSRAVPVDETIVLNKNNSYTFNITNSGTLHYIANLEYHRSETEVVDAVQAGLRITEVHTKDDNNLKTNSKYYRYEKLDTPGVSSGVRGLPITFENKYQTRNSCSTASSTGGVTGLGSYTHCKYIALSSNSANMLFNQRGYAIYYPFVCVSNGDPDGKYGMEEHEFIINRNTTNQLIWGSGEFIPFQLNNADAVNNGFPKKVTVYTKKGNSFVKAQQTINTYAKDNTYSNTVNSYVVQKDFNPIRAGLIHYGCTAEDVNKTYPYAYCSATHTHQWHIDNGYSCIAPGNNNITVYRNHPCYGKPVNSIIQHDIYFDYEVSTFLTVVREQHISERYYMDNTVAKTYDRNGENPITTTTKYYYDNNFHRLPTRTKVTDSKGNQTVTKTYYPDDVTSVSSLPGGNLTQTQYNAITKLKRAYQNQSATPIQVETYEEVGADLSKLSTQRTLFKDWGNAIILPEAIKTAKGNEDIKNRIQYHKYDSSGNPLEVSKADGSHIIYIWGYNDTYPIAKIENATYTGMPSDVTTLINQIRAASNTENAVSSENAMRSQFDALRAKPFLKGALITSYTYDPMIGATSVTDPRGYTMTYHYDDFNRLEFVKDQDDNIISENKYQYKQ
ncbi:hypothetical protein [Aquimarina sp. MMG016]|uniref:hypothetical protein n=1 Tax=Aquimarina sp. MMG016 TaxID=2822690 RepID=UPI001B39CF6F|nr:hypothetical protein [Aquimarina sp. MMG016]MBQ4819030.1 hypothetical protein [Aquimarina sp. MMG016]